MKRARFSEEQIIGVLKEAEAGAKVSELCRQHGISDASFYAWRSKYGGLEISERRPPRSDRNQELGQRLRALAEERRRWGCPMLYHLIRREGWRVNHKRVERP